MSNSNRGRPKGSPNKLSGEVKSMILEVFEKLGGVEGMVKWVESDPANAAIFYGRIMPKMLPRPAVEMVAAANVPTGGVFTWRTPEWAKKAQKRAAFRAETARAASAVDDVPGPKPRPSPGAADDDGARRSLDAIPDDWDDG